MTELSNERLRDRIASLTAWIAEGKSATPERDQDILAAFTELLGKGEEDG